MYDELVKRLRVACMNCKFWDSIHYCINGPCDGSISIEAADAIEELQKQLREEKVDNVNLTGWLAEEHAKHLWIPVTERLPKPTVVVQITDGKEVGHGYLVKTSKYYGWMSPFCDLDEDGITHWMPLPEPPRESES